MVRKLGWFEKPRQPEKGTFLGVFQASSSPTKVPFSGWDGSEAGMVGKPRQPEKGTFPGVFQASQAKKVPFFGVGWLGSPDGWEPVKGTFFLFVFRFYLFWFVRQRIRRSFLFSSLEANKATWFSSKTVF